MESRTANPPGTQAVSPWMVGGETAEPLPAMRLVRHPKTARILAWVLGLMALVTVPGLFFAPWQQNVSGTGRVIALAPPDRQQTIGAPVDGRVVKWYVVEGSKVKQGDPILEIADNDPGLMVRLETEKSAVEYRLQAARSRESQLADRIVELEGSLRADLSGANFRTQMAVERLRGAEQALTESEARALSAKQNIDRMKKLEPRGLASVRQVEVAEADHIAAIAQVERARNSLNAARNEEQAFRAERTRIDGDRSASIKDARASRASAQGEIASAAASMQQIDVRIARQRTQSVTAPRDGTIFQLLVQPGSEFIKAGDPICSFVPESQETVVALMVDGNDMPLISAGRSVRVNFEGWPAVQFVGWPSVAVGTFGGIVRLVDATDDGSGKFRILVEPDPKDDPWPSSIYLRQGVRANGWVLLNQVSLGFEMWRQFNGFPPVISQSAPGKDGGKKEKKNK